jgi:hypothetical protein
MKYLLILLALSATSLYANTYQGKNGKAAHNRNGTAVHTNNGTAVHTNANWDDAYWHSNKYGYWNGQRGYWHVVSGEHVFVVLN